MASSTDTDDSLHRPHRTVTAHARLRSRWAAVGAAVAVTIGAAGVGGYNIVSADTSDGDRPVYVAIAPCRLLDTRPGTPNIGDQNGPLGPDQTVTIDLATNAGNCTDESAIPSDALALALNVTALGQTERTFLTVWGQGDDPGTSSLNPEPGAPPTPNAVTTPLSGTNTFNIRNNAGDVNVIADVVGYYVGHDHDDRYYTEAEVDVAISAAIDAAVSEATAPPTVRRLGAYDFTLSPILNDVTQTFVFPAGTIQFGGNSPACIGATLALDGAEQLDAIELVIFGSADERFTGVIVETLPASTDMTAPNARLIDDLDIEIPTGDPTLTQVVRVEAIPNTIDTENKVYALNICGGDALALVAVDIITS